MTSFDFAAAPIRDVGVIRVIVEVDTAGAVLTRWAGVMASAPRAVTSAVQVFPTADGFVARIDAVVAEPAQLEDPQVTALKRVGRVLEEHTHVAAYPSLLPVTDVQPTVGQQPAVVTNGFLDTITTEVASRLMHALSHPSRPVLLLRAVNGAVHDVGPSDTAFAHRHQNVLAVLAVFPPYGAEELDAAWAGVEPHTDGAYLNFETRPDTPHAFRRAFPGAVGQRFLRLQSAVDPTGLLRHGPGAASPAG